MSTENSQFGQVIPYLSVKNSQRLVTFLVATFGASQTYQNEAGSHIEVSIGESRLMIGDVGAGDVHTAQLFMYVPDADSLYEQALSAGGTALMPPEDREWGEDHQKMRGAGITDPSGNTWFFASPKE